MGKNCEILKSFLKRTAAVFSCCLLISMVTYGQDSPYFFKRLNVAKGSEEHFRSFKLIDNTIVTTFTTTYTESGYLGIGFTKTEIESNSSSEALIFESDTAHYWGAKFGSGFTFHNKIIDCGGYSGPNRESDPIIYIFNCDGDLLSAIDFYKPGFNRLWQGTKSHDNHFLFIGESNDQDMGNFMVMKTDTIGNLLWEGQYGTNYYEYGAGLVATQDNGCLLFGDSRGYGLNLGFYNQTLLIKIDSAGNEQWRKIFGGPTDDGAWCATTGPDDEIVVSGAYGYDEGFPRAFLRKLDPLGNVVWDTIFDYDSTRLGWVMSLINTQVLNDGSIVSSGSAMIRRESPAFLKFSSDGSLEHFRTYGDLLGPEAATPYFSSNGFFGQLTQLSDGGYIGGGTFYPGSLDTGSQDFFLLRLDSIGCEFPNCYYWDSINAIDTSTFVQNISHSFEVKAFPNPFSGIIQFQTQSSSGGDILIYDLRGVLVDRLSFKPSQFTISYDGTALPSGMYIAAFISNTKDVSWVKIVKY